MSKIHALLDPPKSQGSDEAPLPIPSRRALLRRLQGLTQLQVADALGVTRGAVAMWENGRNEPGATVRAQYAELLRLIAERHGVPFDLPEGKS